MSLVDLPQPNTKKKRILLSLLPNTVTNIMYSITPSHNIQQKADMNKYCKSAATNLQLSCVHFIADIRISNSDSQIPPI